MPFGPCGDGTSRDVKSMELPTQRRDTKIGLSGTPDKNPPMVSDRRGCCQIMAFSIDGLDFAPARADAAPPVPVG